MTAFLLYGAISAAATLTAFATLFSQFAPWDDEGTLLVMLNAFVHGEVLYRDIYSPYGPFYFELFGAFFHLTGLSVSTDASRLIVATVWVGASLLVGLAVQRLTGRLILGAAGMVVAFSVLSILVNEPMHPQDLVVLLIATLTLIVVSDWVSHRRLASGIAVGALLAMLVMTKLNVGVFAVAAAVLAAVLTVPPLTERRWLRWLIVASFLAMPLAVMVRDWRLEWVRDFATLDIVSAAAVAVAAWPRSTSSGRDPMFSWLLAATAGFLVTACLAVGAVLLTGTGLADLWDGLVVQALRIRDAFVIPFTIPTAAVSWGILSLALAAWLSVLRQQGRSSAGWWGAVRILSGLAIWFTIANASPFALNPAANDVTLPLVLAWLAVSPPQPIGVRMRFVRTFLAALAVGEVLQTYPVAGSQVGIAALCFVAIGAICISDGLRQLGTLDGRTSVADSRDRAVGLGGTALLAILVYSAILRPGMTNALKYHEQAPLPFVGAHLLRLPPPEAETYERLVRLIHRYECTTLVGYPSLNSLYLWSSVTAPRPGLPGPWIKLLDDTWQRRTLSYVHHSRRPCVIRNDGLAEFWLQGGEPPPAPLIGYVNSRKLAQVARVGEFEFLLLRRDLKRARRRR